MKSLMKYFKDYKLESILGPLFKLLEASFELFVPLVMAQIIEGGLKTGIWDISWAGAESWCFWGRWGWPAP